MKHSSHLSSWWALILVLFLLSSCPGPLTGSRMIHYSGNGSDGGVPPHDELAYAPGSTAVVLGNTGKLTNGDLVFSGWNTNSDGSGETYLPGNLLTVNGVTVTLYAVWRPWTTSSDLQINELVSAVSTGSPAAIELWNPTDRELHLADYQLRMPYLRNNAVSAPAQTVLFSLPAVTIPAHEYLVLRSKLSADFVSGGLSVVLDDGSTPAATPWISRDAGMVELVRGETTIDFVRWGKSAAASPAIFAFDGVAPAMSDSNPVLARSTNGQFSHSAADWSVQTWNTLGGRNDLDSPEDSDGDGLPDSSEVSGGTLAGLPLASWGATPSQPDIFVHVDFMERLGAPLAVTPQEEALDMVVAVFAQNGIAVHFDAGDLFSDGRYNLDGRHHGIAWSDNAKIGTFANTTNVNYLKAASMPVAKSRSFFYLLLANSQDSSAVQKPGGVAYINGNVALVTLGDWTFSSAREVINAQAATILHELGHNLGLRHGGNEETNFKPNYRSIMNYLYSYAGLPATGNEMSRYFRAYDQAQSTNIASTFPWTNDIASTSFQIDFSHGLSSDLDENHLNELLGLGSPGSSSIDFNHSGTWETDLSCNLLELLDPAMFTGSAKIVLHDSDDWANVSAAFQTREVGQFSDRFRTTNPVKTSVRPRLIEILSTPGHETAN